MKKIPAFLFVVVSCCCEQLCSVSAAQEIKYPSPDGRVALRITQSKDDEYHPMVELIEKDSGKMLVTLHNGRELSVKNAGKSKTEVNH